MLWFLLVLNPIWLVPAFTRNQQIAFLLVIALGIAAATTIFYLALGRVSPHKQQLSGTKLSRNVVLIIIGLFVLLNIPALFHSVQNCGDETSFFDSFLEMRSAASILLFKNGFMSLLTMSGIVLTVAGAIARKWKHHLILIAAGVLLLSAGIIAQELASDSLRTALQQDQTFWSVTYSPMSTWFRTPVAAISGEYLDFAMRALSLLFSVATLLLIYWFFTKWYSSTAALFATAIYAFSSSCSSVS
jgi:hypothetical protein